MFKVNNKDINGIILVCLLLTFEHISRLFLVFQIVDFEQVNVCWACFTLHKHLSAFVCLLLRRRREEDLISPSSIIHERAKIVTSD